MTVCHNYADMTMVQALPSVDFLDWMIAKIGRIALALKSISDIVFYRCDINTLVAAGLCELNIREADFTQNLGAPLLESRTIQKVSFKQHFVSC